MPFWKHIEYINRTKTSSYIMLFMSIANKGFLSPNLTEKVKNQELIYLLTILNVYSSTKTN